MDAATRWQRYQDWLYFHSGLGIYLDVSRMSFDDSFAAQMSPRFDEAFKAMDELESGAMANPDENRMVGHYWLRNPEIAPNDELKQAIVEGLKHIDRFVADVHQGAIKASNGQPFTDVLSIGIGGSALGPQFVSKALAATDAPLKIHFIDNTDPTGIDKTLAELGDRLATCLVITISKSGGTPETRNGMLEAQHAFKAKGIDFAKHAVAITGYGSNLENVAKQEGWLATFPMHDWVGGRTSELSAVGLLPAALEGIDIHGMLAGAKEMDYATRVPALKNNPAALLAMSWYFAGDGKGSKDMVLLPYKDSLLLFSRYLQQLVMESLGKEHDLNGNVVNQGIAVYGNKGSTDQHAYVQQLRDGIPNFFMTFIEVLRDRKGDSIELEDGITAGDFLTGFLMGTRDALAEKNRDSITITVPDVSPQIVGALMALYERAVGFYATLVNINAYHQPGVEAGKKAAAKKLSLQQELLKILAQASSPLSLGELATKAKAEDQQEAIYLILRHLASNNRGIEMTGDLRVPGSLKISSTNH